MSGWGGNDGGFVNLVPAPYQQVPAPQQQRGEPKQQQQQHQHRHVPDGQAPPKYKQPPPPVSQHDRSRAQAQNAAKGNGFVQMVPLKGNSGPTSNQQQVPQTPRSGGQRSALPVNPNAKRFDQPKGVKYADVTPKNDGPKVTYNSVFADSAATKTPSDEPTERESEGGQPKVLRLMQNKAYEDSRPRQETNAGPTKVVQVGFGADQKKKVIQGNRHPSSTDVDDSLNRNGKPKKKNEKGGVMKTMKRASLDFFGLSGDPYAGMYGAETAALNPKAPVSPAGKMFQQTKPNNNPPPKVLNSATGGLQPSRAINEDDEDNDFNGRTYKMVDKGLAAYNEYVKVEKLYNKKNGLKQFGNMTMMKTIKRQMTAQSTIGSTGTLKLSQATMLQHELLSLPEFKPIFIKSISFIQFLVMAAMIAFSMTEQEFAKFGFSAEANLCAEADCPVMFNGTADTTAIKIVQVNPWLGPNTNFLIAFNAKYSLCMREDTETTLNNERQRFEECGNLEAENQFNAVCDGVSGDQYEGKSCCVLGISTNRTNRIITSTAEYATFKTSGTAYGMLTKKECMESPQALYLYPSGFHTLCSSGSTGITTTVPITVRPCCVGVRGKCQLLTKSQCVFKAGVYHEDEQLCGDVACLEDICTTKTGAKPDQQPHPKDSDITNGNQWYRFIAPLFIHSGGVSFIIVLIAQVYLGGPIERTVGFLRMFLIYFISGVGGYLVSGLFDPYVVSVGANPAVFGLLGVMLVELVQSWSVVPNPKRKLAKLMLIITVAVLLGSLPFIDNYAQIGGFLFGIISACIFLPYIALGKWHERRRKCVLAIAAPLLLILVILLVVLFYAVQNTEFCPGCKYLNCWQWHPALSCDGQTDD